MKRQIFKVQISLHTSEPKRQVLAYNKDHSIYHQMDATKSILKFMQGAFKRYVYGWLNDKKEVVFDEFAPNQNW